MFRDVIALLGLVIAGQLCHYGSAQLGAVPQSFTAKEPVSEGFVSRDTDTTLYSAYNFLKCTSDKHVTPTSTQQVSDLVRELMPCSNRSQSKPVKIRATRRDFHSMAGFVCAGHRASSKRPLNQQGNSDQNAGTPHTSVTVLLHLMNRVVSTDTENRRLTVEAGMTLQTLVDWAQANRMSVPGQILPAYGNLTVGGVISTSAHGSGYGTTSTLGDVVTKMTWVNGRGDIIVSDLNTERGSKEVAALVGGLGLLGIITEVTLQLEPLSFTIVETRNNLDDRNLVSELENVLKHETPWVLVQWKPEFGMYRAGLYKKVDELPASGAPAFRPNAKSAIMGPVDDGIASTVKTVLAAWEADPDEESPVADVLNSDVCSISEAFFSTSFFKDEDGTPLDNTTVSTNNAMLAPECAPMCSTQTKCMGAATDDVEFVIKFSQFEDWVADVKAIIKAELQQPQSQLDSRYGKGKVKRCLPPGVIWFRFGQKSKSLLAMNAGTENVVYAQWSSMQSAMIPDKPAKQASIIETIEQLSLCKYKARPHWGKLYERVFRHPKCHLRDNIPESNIAQFLEMQELHDPAKLFEPELFKHVMERSGPVYSEECSLTYWCYCLEDVHCPRGYVCRPSPTFPMYNICKRPAAETQHVEL